MTQTTAVGHIPVPDERASRVPAVLTKLVWLLWIMSVGVLAMQWRGESWELAGVFAIDGLTAVMWMTVTFFSGIVHSYSRRYMAGNRTMNRFFALVFAFTLIVSMLVAADQFILFGVAWLTMGLVMAGLIGHMSDWPQSGAAASVARRYFLASSGALSVALVTLWYTTGVTTVSGLGSSIEMISPTVAVFVAGALLVAAMIQSALLPFHTWLLSSMTAPTPASALMHAGLVNAGGVLLVRFGSVITVEPAVMLAVIGVGAVSALGGKLLKTVQTDIKGKLGCSTVGQMGFMIMQVGLGFFGAAITHLILHGFYKAYSFLSAGEQVEHKQPATKPSHGSAGVLGGSVIVATALAGGVLFALLTGKGTKLDSGLLLTLLVVLTVLHAAREIVTVTAAPTPVRYGAVPMVTLPAIALYAAVYRGISSLMAGLPGMAHSVALTPIHGLVAIAFLATYLAMDRGVYRRSTRLYVALLNASQPPRDVLTTATEEYNEY
jgi:NAD(P)H-quinone oxidoreductase subunit 5